MFYPMEWFRYNITPNVPFPPLLSPEQSFNQLVLRLFNCLLYNSSFCLLITVCTYKYRFYAKVFYLCINSKGYYKIFLNLSFHWNNHTRAHTISEYWINYFDFDHAEGFIIYLKYFTNSQIYTHKGNAQA